MTPIRIVRELSREAAGLRFGPPVTYVYNPLDYARESHDAYVRRFAHRGIEALLLGMNPGPYGMVQTGVPFGEVGLVRRWLGIEARIHRPVPEHPKRPVLGFKCPRSEVSGRRFWSWAERRFITPANFFRRFFVWNWCPLAFLEKSGRNRTPDKLPVKERTPLAKVCDRALRRIVDVLEPRLVIGVGAFAEKQARVALQGSGLRIGGILHPSPASPAANRDWSQRIDAQLRALGVRVA